jgi:N-acetylglutamate synthase-like GNAT family acetyltransferase
LIEVATIGDAQEILALQKLAYQSEAALHDDYTLPPLTQTLEQMEQDFQHQVVLKATVNGEIIGSVRAHMRDGTCFIGRLIVHPDLQNRGIGTRLMQEIESYFNQAQRYELFTGHKSERNLYLYHKLGYQEYCSERLTDRVTLVFMEKLRRQ